MSDYPEHDFDGFGEDPRCKNCGERSDFIGRAVRPCLANESLKAKFWHEGLLQYGLLPFGSTDKPISAAEPKKSKKPAVPTLF